MYNFQITLNADYCKVDFRTDKSTILQASAENQNAEPIATRSSKVNITKFYWIVYGQKRTGEKIESILVDNQNVLLVLFRGHQSVDDQCIGCRSYNSDDYDSAHEVELDTIWRRWHHSIIFSCNLCHTCRCRGNRQVHGGWSFLCHSAPYELLALKQIHITLTDRRSDGSIVFIIVAIFLRATAGTAIARLSHLNSVCLSVRLSLCLSHGWIRQKRCKLGSLNLHHRLPQRL